MKPLPRIDVPTSDNGCEITSPFCTEKFPYERSKPSSRRAAVKAAQDAGAAAMDKNNKAAGRQLTLREHQMVLAGRSLEPDDRSMLDRILEDGETRSNAETDSGGDPIRRALGQLNNRRTTKAQQEAVERLLVVADEKDDEHQALLDKAERESSPVWQRAFEHAEREIRIQSRDGASEERIDECESRLEKLLSGELSAVDYWAEINGEVGE